MSTSIAAISCLSSLVMAGYTRKQVTQNSINDQVLVKLEAMDQNIHHMNRQLLETQTILLKLRDDSGA
jgi:hypothetical protein